MRRAGRIVAAVVVGAALVELALRGVGQLYLSKLYAGSRPRPGEIAVLCLGESSTGGLWVAPEESYPARLEALLRTAYAQPVRFVVPPHLGQNTSQMANRIDGYLDLYQPRLVIVMAGANNTWSLAESHIGAHLQVSSLEAARVRALVALNELRLFKVARYAALRLFARDDDYLRQNRALVWGHPELVPYPPPAWTYGFARDHRAAFAALWRDDVGRIVRRSRGRGARVLLMTYPIAPSDLPAEAFVAQARDESVGLARNDLAFQELADSGRLGLYLFADDHWHPNPAGYALVAWTAFEAIASNDLLGLGRPLAAVSAPAAPSPVFTPLPADGHIDPGAASQAAFFGEGWARPEPGIRWTAGGRADLHFSAEPGHALRLRLRAQPLVSPGRLDAQRVRVLLNGASVGALTFTGPEEQELELVLPQAGLRLQNTISLELPDACTPASLGLGADVRTLALAVRWLELTTAQPLAPTVGRD